MHWLWTRTDSGWTAQVKLRPGKYWYKFIVDGNWMVDSDNRLNENDGRGNINSVFFRTNTVFQAGRLQ
ncbi:MAG: glycogen-binding domain-containing protein [Bacteroidota bacterium]